MARAGLPWTAIAIIVGVVAVVGLVAAGLLMVVDKEPTRSTEAFCATLKSEQERILSQLDANLGSAEESGDEFAELFLTLTAGVQALGELQTYFEKLAKAAPAEIQTEAEIVADKIDEVMEVPELSFEGFAGSVMASMQISGQLNALDAFAREHCGRSI